MGLEGIILSEKKSEKDKYYVTLLTCGTYKSQTHRNKEQNGFYQGPREWGRNGENVGQRYKLQAIR